MEVAYTIQLNNIHKPEIGTLWNKSMITERIDLVTGRGQISIRYNFYVIRLQKLHTVFEREKKMMVVRNISPGE